MSKLKEEIERRLKESGMFDDNTAPTEDALKPDEEAPQDAAPASEINALQAPQSFDAKFAADFANLSPEWQHFLCTHEDQVIQTLASCADQLKQYAELEQMYRAHCADIHSEGKQKLVQWLAAVAEIDTRLHKNPAETLQALGWCYGVHMQPVQPTDNNLTKEVVGRLCELERSYHSLKDFMQHQQEQRLTDVMQMFGHQTDAKGTLLHPYFEAVKAQVFELLQTGAASNVDEAYDKALWLNPDVRAELIKQKISAQALEAQRAKDAAFAPHGKTQAPQKKLTLRKKKKKNIAAYAE